MTVEFQQGYNYHIAQLEFDRIDKDRLEYRLFRNLKIYIMSTFFTESINMKKKTLSSFYSDLAWIYIEYFKNYDDQLKVANFLANSESKSIAELMNEYLIEIDENDRLKTYFDRINYFMSYMRIIETKNNNHECNIFFYNRIARPHVVGISTPTYNQLCEILDFMNLEYDNASVDYSLNFNDFMIEYNKLERMRK